MGDEAEFAEEDVEEAAPLIVVGVGELENDGDVGFDVHRLKNGDGRSSGGGSRSFAGDGGSWGGWRRRGAGHAETEERIVVHVIHGNRGGR